MLSEKPLAMSFKEAEELVDLAEKKGAVTGIDFCYRYYPMVREMAARVRKEEAGNIRMATGSYFQDWLSMETDWSWRLLRSESGESNITADLGSHWFDLLQFITGFKVKEVFGDLATIIPVRKKPKRQVLAFENAGKAESEDVEVELEDYSSVLFRLGNGAPGSFTASQVCSGRKSDTEIQVYGSKCSYAWNHKESDKLWIGHREKPNEILMENPVLQDPSTIKYATLPAGHPLGYRDAVLNLFKDYVKTKYQGISSLNEIWETNYQDFSKIEPVRKWGAVEELAKANDQLSFIESEYARYHEMASRAIKKYVPDAKVGAEGSQPGNSQSDSCFSLCAWCPLWFKNVVAARGRAGFLVVIFLRGDSSG